MKLFAPLLICLLFVRSTQAQIGFDKHPLIDELDLPLGLVKVSHADIDGDGDMDLLTASQSDNKIAWYENTDGQVYFSDAKIITLEAEGAIDMLAVDFDSDGDMDVLAASSTNNMVAWYENIDGQGAFGATQVINTNAQSVRSIYASDLDGDGDMDVLSASNQDGIVAWYENTDGLGSFGAPLLISTETLAPSKVYAEDLDGDGDQDILFTTIVNFGFGGFAVWCENVDGQGTFGPKQTINDDVNTPIAINAGDLDGDGDIDVVVGSSEDNKTSWYENLDGQGTFGSSQPLGPEAHRSTSVHIDDLDGDGDLDILATFQTTNKISWFENTNGQGDFTEQNMANVTNISGPISALATDLDGDNDLDVVSASFENNELHWFENTDGLADFGDKQLLLRSIYGGQETLIVDVDGDGDLDVLSGSYFDNKIAWHEHLDGAGTFGPQKIISLDATGLQSIATGDMDGDGDLDILSASRFDSRLSWYKNLDGQGTFGQELTIANTSNWGTSIYASDLDGDGDLDVISCTLQDDKVAWYENTNGIGNFGGEQVITTDADGANFVYAADIDGDGDMDVLSSSSFDNKIAWYENTNGQGSFSGQQIISDNQDFALQVHVTDIDSDGDLDVLSASLNDNTIAWFENEDGQGNFGSTQIITTSAIEAISVFASDIDGDGDMDVLSASESDEKIAWYENIDGGGTFGVPQSIDMEITGPNFIRAGDLDADGDMDVLAIGFSGLAWYENQEVISNRLEGIISLDVNANGCDASDIPAINRMVITQSDTETFASFSTNIGFYQLFPSEGDFTSTVMLPEFYSADPVSVNSSFVGVGNEETIDFCLNPNQDIDDLSIVLFPTSEARPGFNSTYQLVYQNSGTTQQSGNFDLIFNDSKMSFLSASQSTSAQTDNSISFNFSDLNPFEIRIIDLEFLIFEPPVVNSDDVLDFTATINPSDQDYTPLNNQFEIEQIVINSFDPNDIRVLEGNEITIEQVAEYLHYIIRFQNTGTASAINVRIENELDPNLDWQSMELQSSSHEYQVEIKDGNLISFIFDEINLPDSTSNEPLSHGFVAYKIKSKSNLIVGDIMSNAASIFFDFNEPIYTNIVTTEIVESTSIEEKPALNFSIYPVPTINHLFIKTNALIANIEIFTTQGNQILSTSQPLIDIFHLSSGLYLCKITDQEGNIVIKKIIKQ